MFVSGENFIDDTFLLLQRHNRDVFKNKVMIICLSLGFSQYKSDVVLNTFLENNYDHEHYRVMADENKSEEEMYSTLKSIIETMIYI